MAAPRLGGCDGWGQARQCGGSQMGRAALKFQFRGNFARTQPLYACARSGHLAAISSTSPFVACASLLAHGRPGVGPAVSRKIGANQSAPGALGHAFAGLPHCPERVIYGTVAREKARKSMTKPHLAVVAPAIANGTVAAESPAIVALETNLQPQPEPRLALVPKHSRANALPPRRRRNAEVRSREYLTEAEVERLINAARKGNRWGHRDATMVLIAFRHGLRAAELVALRWDQVDLNRGEIHVARVKGSRAGVHPLRGVELRALKRWKREQEPASPYVFTSERGAPFSTDGWRKLIARLGVAAGFDFPVHPHMLRHATGYKLANEGVDTRTLQAYLGHANIQHTVRYAELAPQRFKDLWRD